MDSILKQVDPASIRDEDEAFTYAMYCLSFSTTANVLNAAIELGLFDIISKTSHASGSPFVSPTDIASQLPTQNLDAAASTIDRMLRVLACHSILSCSLRHLEDGSVERLYGIAPIGKAFVSTENGRSLSSFKPIKAIEVAWLDLKDLVLEGGNLFEKAHGLPIYEYMSKHPEASKSFNELMTDLSRITMTKVVDMYDGFEGLSSVVDLGGGIGATLNIIISKYPFIKGINFDEPHVVQNAPSYPGIEHVGGNMFSSIPKADAIFMKNILHNWGDDSCFKILKNCYNALPRGGKVIALSLIMPETPQSSLAAKYTSNMDVLMLMHEGKQRTEKDFRAMSKAAGFSGFRFNGYAYFVGIMEFVK